MRHYKRAGLAAQKSMRGQRILSNWSPNFRRRLSVLVNSDGKWPAASSRCLNLPATAGRRRSSGGKVRFLEISPYPGSPGAAGLLQRHFKLFPGVFTYFGKKQGQEKVAGPDRIVVFVLHPAGREMFRKIFPLHSSIKIPLSIRSFVLR